jgi:tetratricopeptide (TPR) repeat protein
VTFLRELDPNGSCGFRDLPDASLACAVERLHGIPRALEVLAGIAKAEPFSSLNEILDSLHEKDEADAMIKEGYRRLDNDERRVMEALAVLSRPVPKVAVEFMLAPFSPGLAVGAVLRRLIELLMVEVERAAKTVKLNPIDQDYARQQLPKDGQYNRKALERRAAQYYAQLSVPREKWRRIADVEPHLLQFEHWMRAEDYAAAAEVLGQLDVRFVIWRGYARRLQSMHLALAGKLIDPRHKMLNAYALGNTCIFLGPLEKALEYLHIAQAAARQTGDQVLARSASGALGEVCRRLGRLEEAINYLEQGLQLPEPSEFDTLPLLLSLTYSYKRRFRDALDCGQRLMDTAITRQNQALQAQAHDALALACLGLGDFEEALNHAEQAEQLYRVREDLDPLAYVLNVQGMAHWGAGRAQTALNCFEQGRSRGSDDDNPRVEAFCLFNLAHVRKMQNDPSQALALATQAGAILTRIGAVEAPAALALTEALRAAETGQRIVQIQALLACARHSSNTADLLHPGALLTEAETLALAEGRDDLVADTQRARGELSWSATATQPV